MRILLIQILRLGDAVQGAIVLKEIKESFPESEIHVLTTGIGAALFENVPEVDRVYVLHKETIAGMLCESTPNGILEALHILRRDIEEIVEQHWDWVINFSFCMPSALLAYLAGGVHCSGFSALVNRKYASREKWFAYAVAAFMHRGYSLFNWVDINRGIVGLGSSADRRGLWLDADRVEACRKELARHRVGRRRLVGIHPGASGDYKRWPSENFSELARVLIQQYDCDVLVFGDDSDIERARDIEAKGGNRVVNLAGMTSISDLAAYMSLCSVVVCNDSGAMHVASGIGTPVIGLFFSTHFVETGPCRKDQIAVYPRLACFPCKSTRACPEQKCLHAIAPEHVAHLAANCDNIIHGKVPACLDDAQRKIKVDVSRYDPWGLIEWVPLDGRAVETQDVLRIILRPALITHLASEPVEVLQWADYIHEQPALSLHDIGSNEIEKVVGDFAATLTALEQTVQACCELCLEFQKELLVERPDAGRIRVLGMQLGEKEKDIESLEKHDGVGLLCKIIEIERNNLVTKSILDLATASGRLYRDALELIRTAKRVGLEVGKRCQKVPVDAEFNKMPQAHQTSLQMR